MKKSLSFFITAFIAIAATSGLFAQNKDATKSEKEVRAWVKK